MNLLIIHTDQLSNSFLSCYGKSPVHTPNIDSLANEGAIFNNFYTNSAICTPSRGCLMTGRYPNQHGAYKNNLNLNPDEVTFVMQLEKTGYKTGYVGKWHLDGELRPGFVHKFRSFGFADNKYMYNRGHFKKVDENWMKWVTPNFCAYSEIGDEKTYLTDWLTKKTIDFIDENAHNDFCHMLSIPDPHDPFTVRAPYDTMYPPEEMEVPDTFYDELPAYLKGIRESGKLNELYNLGEKHLKEVMSQYCGMIKLIDDNVGLMIAELKQKGIYDKTIVVFTSDHGEYMGDHGLYFKNHFYKTCYRIPMIIRYPEKIAAGTKIDALASTVDFQQTILSLMEVECCGREKGKDLSPVFSQDGFAPNEYVYFYHCDFEMAAAINKKYHFGMFKDGSCVLFDIVEDPKERKNLSDNPAYAGEISEFKEKIRAHHKSNGAPNYEWLFVD